MPRGYFFTAVLALNNHGEIALFEVKLKRKTHGTSVVSIYLVTNDIPPLPVGSDDVLRVAFYLENSIGTTPIRIKMAEASFLGHFLDGKAVGQSTATLRTDGAEWQFAKMHHATGTSAAASSTASSTSSLSSTSSSAGLSSAAATASSTTLEHPAVHSLATPDAAPASPISPVSLPRSGSSSSFSPTPGAPAPEPAGGASSSESTWYITAITLKVPDARAKEYLTMSKHDS